MNFQGNIGGIIVGAAMVISVLCGPGWLLHVDGADLLNGRPVVAEPVTQNGLADWTNGVVTATGIGFPPTDMTGLQAKLMAKKAAHGVALRNLLEALKAVRVDSTTTVKNYVVASDEIRVHVEGVIEGARIVKERELEKGAYETTVELKLTGEMSGMFLPKNAPKTGVRLTDKVPPAFKGGGRVYTGLVVDARGTGIQPAMAPRILNEDGVEAYSQIYVKTAFKGDQGIVAYVPDIPSAESNPRVTNYPLVVKAVRAANSSRTDLVITNADAQTIHGVPDHFSFLEKGQVIIVLDSAQGHH